ncbi:MAG: WYL domain-containing protein [Clostridiales bacterium]|nr:WYL domain-containing protein [Clostridiales bacterium]
MAAFSELIKNFDKIRDYIRDFYIYGFKTRNDFKQKSNRSYDNEKRRIESYLRGYIKQSYTKSGKQTVINLDSSKIKSNPLYAAWKSKSFTANDIMLHFYLLDILKKEKSCTVLMLTNKISEKSGKVFDNQTVRLKCVEYEKEGILVSEKIGRLVYYSLATLTYSGLNFKYLGDAINFFSEASYFGEIGSYIIDNSGIGGNVFSYKHHYLVHTLEGTVLYETLLAMESGQRVKIKAWAPKSKAFNEYIIVPLKILISSVTGRRYLCFYSERENRFGTLRLDSIKSVKILDTYGNYAEMKIKLENNLDKVWGVGFGGRSRIEGIKVVLYIDEEREKYIIERIIKERRSGSIEKIGTNTFVYTNICFDASEMAPWIKTFIGRVIYLECTNPFVKNRFSGDLAEMYKMYFDDSI